MSSKTNIIPLILIIYLIKNKDGFNFRPPVINTLQLESILDNARVMLSAVDKINSFAENAPEAIPNMKKLMEVVEKIPL